MSRRMEEGHLRSKTLKSILQTRDITAKNETRNFENRKICYGASFLPIDIGILNCA